MFCENCGTKLLENSSFCEECGNKVSFLDNETKGNESIINEENFNIKKEPGLTRQRGPVPPALRPTPPRQPSEHSGGVTKPRQPSEPNGKETAPRRPSETYDKEMARQQHSTINRPVSDKLEYNKTNYPGADIISFGQYVFMIFLSGIPIVNIILFVKWGFFNKQSPNKSNFAKALLFYYLIAVIIYVAYIYLWLKATSSI